MTDAIGNSSVDFPDPRNTLTDGLVAVGGVLDVPTLYTAYSRGIFPWPQEGFPMLWFSPEQRGVLFFKDFHVPESLNKFKRKNPQIEFKVNKNFPMVIKECSLQPRPFQKGTWISSEMIEAYNRFYEAGFGLCVEVWEEAEMIGGIYGVNVNGVFSGESMFYKKPNASKLAFWYLVDYLKAAGHEWIDVQMVTPIISSFGGRYISREDFLLLLKNRQKSTPGVAGRF